MQFAATDTDTTATTIKHPLYATVLFVVFFLRLGLVLVSNQLLELD